MAARGPTPEQAAAELLRRRVARADPVAFARYCFPFDPAPHHQLILRVLAEALSGKDKRVMICMPPGFGKSVYASLVFPAWAMGVAGNDPAKKAEGFRIVGASHTQPLANTFSARVRNAVATNEYQRLFGTELRTNAVEHWETVAGGEYVAAGVGVGIAGRRAHLAIIDDPFPNAESAESPIERDRVWRWYVDDLTNRLLPDAIIILIQTRWHLDDLAGRLIANEVERGGQKWRKVFLPYLAKENDILGRAQGERLWSDYYPPEEIDERRRQMLPRSWSALWQQEPIPESGDFFERRFIRYYDKVPANMRVYMSSDYATQDGRGDHTVFLIGGVDEKGDLYLLDMWRSQATTDRWIDAGVRLANEWNPMVWIEESGPIWRSVNSFIIRRMQELHCFKARRQLPSIVNKRTRAIAIRDRMEMGKVYFPRNAPWIGEFEKELMEFDAGTKDDMVDAFSLMGRMLHTMTPKRPVEKSREQRLEELRAQLATPTPPTMDKLWADHDRERRMRRAG